MDVVIIVQPQSHLLQAVLAFGPSRRFSRLLDGRKQQGDQNAEDRDDDEKFNERETSSTTHRSRPAPIAQEWRDGVHAITFGDGRLATQRAIAHDSRLRVSQTSNRNAAEHCRCSAAARDQKVSTPLELRTMAL